MATDDPSQGTTRQILVFILRHGEREDEVTKSSKLRRLPPARRFDPALTPKGHQQARNAWKQLSHALSSADCKRISIFTSPLRRAVGTAMMVSETVSMVQENGWQVVVPGGLEEDEQYRTAWEASDRDIEDPSAIPIIVWNGLCDCAAQIERIGGHQNAIRTGFVSCAATEHLVPNTFHDSAMASTWKEMRQAAASEGTTDDNSSAPIQFWNADCFTKTFVPMSPKLPTRNSSLQDDTKSSAVSRDADATRITHHWPIFAPMDPSVDQAVHAAMEAGCDACIIASHREEIRELYKYRCGYRFSRKSLDYCCIGAFDVSKRCYDNNETSPLEWRLHDVSSNLTPQIVRDMRNFSTSPAAPTNGSCQLQLLPSVTGNSFGPCLVALVEAGTIPVEEQGEIIDIQFDTRVYTSAGTATNRRSTMTLAILSGAIRWTEALLVLAKDGHSMNGTASIQSRSTQRVSKFQVLLHPKSQRVLPCPPRTIHLDVLEG